MCGIAGFVAGSVSAEHREAMVRAMCVAMVHRGPDDQGLATRDEATLGSCRLAIFDPANGQQPMVSPDRRWTLVFNGAIYNFRSLRAELATHGWRFQTECDTEVLLAAFATWGRDALRRLRGMYAFAVWDAQEQTLFAARDPLGIKPLYYQQRDRGFVFASEINALLESGAVQPEIDPAGVADYLAWFAVPAPATIYRRVFSLRPGECATFHAGRLTVDRAWHFDSIPAAPVVANYEEFVQQLRGRLDDTIRAHMLADVPVGAFLSGGLDSAAIVGLMTRASGVPLRTFSIGFDETEFSELDAAAATARHFGAHHETHVLTGAEVAHDIEKVLGALDQPTGDGINTYYASRLAHRGGVTVALSGLGGDELFGGYPSFRDTPRLARWLPLWRSMPGPLRAAFLGRLQRGDTRARKLADVLAHARNIHEVGALQRRVFSAQSQAALLHADTHAAIGDLRILHPSLAELSADLTGAGTFEIVSAWELRTYMADVLLRDSDVMSMRHSLELRVPFIDRELIEWLWRQPAKAAARPAKSALYDAVRDLLPPDMAHRRKRGFTLPFPLWMKRELRPFLDETFSDASVGRTGLFAHAGVQQLWRGFLVGSDTREWSRVWSLAILIQFANRRSAVATRRNTGPTPVHIDQPLVVKTVPAKPPRSTPGGARTLVLSPEIYASEGGIARILQLYVRALCENAGPERRIRLVTLNDAPADCVAPRRALNGTLEDARACSRSKLTFVREALELARGCDTLVCGHIRQLPVAWLAQRFNRSLRYFLVAHGIEVWRPFSRAERVALRGATRVLCVSDFTRRELLKHCPLPDDRAIVLPNALDPVFTIGRGRPLIDCAPTILVVTRITYADRYKGVGHMIEAMPAIRAAIPQAKLRIIGRGDDVPRLTRLRDSLGLAEAVEFPGYVDDGHLAEEMRSCRLFALPSRKEGFGLVFLEAMAHGRPCLGAAAGGIPEVITPECGVLVPYGDVAAIATAAIAALQRPWDEDRIIARARAFGFEPFKHRLAIQLAA